MKQTNKKSKTPGLDSLEFSANIFEFRDWDYTRVTNMDSIRYVKDHDRQNTLSYRISRSWRWLFEYRGKNDYLRQFERTRWNRFRSRVMMSIFSLKRDRHLPDGVLDGGSVITFWEETGEYLSLMQPTVGSLLVEFLRAEPEHPHAIIISKEIERLHRRMRKRWKNGEITGEVKDG